MYSYYSFNNGYWFLMIISLIVSLYANFRVKSAFNKYSKIQSHKKLDGLSTANIILQHNNIKDISIYPTHGYFTDYFDSTNSKICLSENVYSKPTVAAVSVAAHECGHAIQNHKNYFPLRLRHMLVPLTQIGSNLAMPFILLGTLVPNWSFAINLGILMFSFAVIFQVVTLPVEFDASRRALRSIEETGILTDDEKEGAKVVLKAAAFTYISATFSALISLLRLLLIYRNRRN